MNAQDMANRRLDLLRKRWDATITSDEQDELDELTSALRILSSQWQARAMRVVKVEA